MSTRDNQRQRVYDGERRAQAARGRDLPTVPDIQQYVDDLLTSRWFQARWRANHRIRVTDGRGRRSAAAYGQSEIRMPLWSRHERVILHEVAHCLTPRRYANHGPEFCGVMLALVRHQMGAEATKSLREGWRSTRVRVTSSAVPRPTKPVISHSATVVALRVAASQPPDCMAVMEAATVLRRAIKNGWFGESGTKARNAALATARGLEERA